MKFVNPPGIASSLRVASLVLLACWDRPALFAQGYSADEACRHMTLPPAFQANLVAAEPMVRQPVAIEFDDRGRLWVIQYLQYPNPAGLKRVRVDRYSRTVYDRVPDPPPRGPKGADRITILDNFDAADRARHSKDFVTGLNLATGLAFGSGGVYVLQAPYLLFYPDRNGDDIPDGDPEVLLNGFGMEDAHSVANSLTWGPDGWLYGCQGSTVTANIRGIEFQQGVWRYHPRTRRFELFCEGGGNSWGLDFDRHGNLFYSTNVGGFVMLHGVQGAYYWKQFGKHGALHNPYAYGYIDHVRHQNFRGGHVTVGGIIYQGDSFPEQFRGKYIAGDLLGHAVYWHDLKSAGSTFRSSHGGELLLANDTWFAPSDVTTGPDGSVYVADWCDKRMAHPDPDADWDRSNGRIYKLESRAAKPTSEPGAGIDFTQLSSEKLVDLLAHPNDWYVRKARRILADRRDPSVIGPLRKRVLESANDQLALQALWALYVSGGFDERFACELLSHRNPDVRRWTVRLLGDECKVSPDIASRFAALAATERDVTIRSQLASTARRLPAEDGLPIVEKLLIHNEDDQDAHIPLLLWWAVEPRAVPAMNRVLAMFDRDEAWQRPLIRDHLLERLVRRYAAEGSAAAELACVRLLKSARTSHDRERLVAALDLGIQERSSTVLRDNLGTLFSQYASSESNAATGRKRAWRVTSELKSLLGELWKTDRKSVPYLRCLSHLDEQAAQHQAFQVAVDRHADIATRQIMLQIVGESGQLRFLSGLLSLIGPGQPELIQVAALDAVERYDQPEIGSTLIHAYSLMSDRLRSRSRQVLLSRKLWALALLEEVDAGRIATKEVPVDELRQVALFQDKKLNELVRKHWGDIRGGTPEEKLAEMRRLSNDLRARDGNPASGHLLFTKHCATCHRLFDEGNRVGPELTYANRHDRDFLLVSLVDPSAVIRKEYVSYVVHTDEGQVFTGLLVAQTAGDVTLLTAKNERTIILRRKIEAIAESSISLMPENLLKELKPAEISDLFSYLQKDKPVALRK
jgi:putative membrane-bound dehydrogenase-like protein